MSDYWPENLPVYTPKLLADAAGWQVSKEGKSLAERGAVTELRWEKPWLRGTVGVGGRAYAVKLKPSHKALHFEAACACPSARRDGVVCAHAAALGHAALLDPEQLQNGQELAPEKEATTSAVSVGRSYLPYNWTLQEDAGPEAVPLFLQILLPVDLDKALPKEHIPLLLEVSLDGEDFSPFDSVIETIPGDRGLAWESLDYQFLRALGQEPRSQLLLPQEHCPALFQALIGHPRVWRGKKTLLEIVQAVPPRYKVTCQKDGSLTVEHTGEDSCGIHHKDGKLVVGFPLDTKFWPKSGQKLIIQDSQVPRFLLEEMPRFEAEVKIEEPLPEDQITWLQVTPRWVAELDGNEDRIEARFMVIYGSFAPEPWESHGAPGSRWLADPKMPWEVALRRHDREGHMIQLVSDMGFLEGNPGQWKLHSRPTTFIANDLSRLQNEMRVTMSDSLQRFVQSCEVLQPVIKVQSHGDWLQADVSFQAKGHVLTLADVQRLLQGGGTGRHGQSRLLVPEVPVRNLLALAADTEAEQLGPGVLKLPPAASFALSTALDGWQMTSDSVWHAPPKLEETPPAPVSKRLAKILRPYQKSGVDWLYFLSQNQLAGLLADDMGLGKTIQALAWLEVLMEQKPGPLLVICPTSLLGNWAEEAAKFTPDMACRIYHGAQRGDLPKDEPGLVLTSYGLVRQETAVFQSVYWRAVVLDEAQNIKNPKSQIARLVHRFQAENRLLLSGTPVENNLSELWSLFQFLLPGYFGPVKRFEESFAKPIRGGDRATATRLKQRVAPFYLRRNKAEVAPELPSLTTQILRAELSNEQKAVYQDILEQGRKQVFDFAGKKGHDGKRRMMMLATLTRLRQASCHLRLLPGMHDREWEQPSVKFSVFEDLFEQSREGGHRCLVFSQFTSLLALLRETLDANQTPYCYLDGSTTARSEEVAKFQQNDDIPLFLISLKAGGSGLNLTAADQVVLFDPWWNPAVEAQAAARAHRIGQGLPVTVYKIIAQGTVEERILQLQAGKEELVRQVIPDDEAAAHRMSLSDLEDLLN
ncbi:MAG: DEAD/DEAH box helicase [Verrucomicrobiales bacterium]